MTRNKYWHFRNLKRGICQEHWPYDTNFTFKLSCIRLNVWSRELFNFWICLKAKITTKTKLSTLKRNENSVLQINIPCYIKPRIQHCANKWYGILFSLFKLISVSSYFNPYLIFPDYDKDYETLHWNRN